jgi:hypothetical protein
MHIYAILISIGIIGLKLNVYFLYTKISILIVWKIKAIAAFKTVAMLPDQ